MYFINKLDKNNLPEIKEEEEIAQFLFTHLEQYGDDLKDIKSAIQYALARENKPGGFILNLRDEQTQMLGVAVILNTQMSGYIPEHILVYIATHHEARGKGIGKQLMQKLIHHCEGNIALHVDRDNPAIHLYEKLGFEIKYFEMRLQKK